MTLRNTETTPLVQYLLARPTSERDEFEQFLFLLFHSGLGHARANETWRDGIH